MSLARGYAEAGLWCWSSPCFGGVLPVAWLSRSSASRSLFCRASSSWACVLTACFLSSCQLGLCEGATTVVLLGDGLVKDLEVLIKVEQCIELVHEVEGNSTAAVRTGGSYASG